MINGVHVILYSADAEADRVFIRDVLGFPGVDAGSDWLIFKLPPAEIAVHPTKRARDALILLVVTTSRRHWRSWPRALTITLSVSEQRWGLLAAIKLPSGADLRSTSHATPLHRPGGLSGYAWYCDLRACCPVDPPRRARPTLIDRAGHPA